MTDEKRLTIDALCKQWIHSREEDTEEETVYRPANFSFPPSRGRAGFELLRDKSYRRVEIGPTDCSLVTEGKWELEGEGEYRMRIECDGVCDTLNVISVNYDRLTIGKRCAS